MIFLALALLSAAAFQVGLVGLITGTPILRTGGGALAFVFAVAFLASYYWRFKWRVRWLRWRIDRRTEVIADIDYQLGHREPLGLTQRELQMLWTARGRIRRRRAKLAARVAIHGYADSLTEPSRRRVA